MTDLLRLDTVGVAYRGVPAVEQLTLSVRAGTIATVIGPNGAGKTTLLHAIMGVLPATGAMTFDGAPLPPGIEARVAAGIALVPERRELFGTMRVEDNLCLGGYTLRRAERTEALARVYAQFPRLRERRTQIAATLSGGERQMLAMGRALMGRPRLLMLDEPSLGLAPLVVRDIFRIVGGLRASGVTVLLVEQNARAALAVADEGHVLEGGRIGLSGTGPALAADTRVARLYLGGQEA